MNTDDYDTLTPDDEELLAGLRRSTAGATLATSAADVVALGRRTRNRHRAVAAGIGTSAAAIVAAVGVLAPSAGSRTLTIQQAGFTLQKHSNGVVDLTVQDVFDPAALRAALDKAGIRSDVQQVSLPADWDDRTPVDCAARPGVERDEKAMTEALMNAPHEPDPAVLPGPGSAQQAVKILPHGGSGVLYEFRPGQPPAGDVVTLIRFDHSLGAGKTRSFSMIEILTGELDHCTPVPAGSPQATGSRM